MSGTPTVSKTRKIAETAIMLALGIVLSLVKLLDLPYGGSITVACMLPAILIAYRYGVGYGLITGLLFGISQQLLGLNTLSYVTTWQSIVAVILLDYIVAFAVIGFGGLFRRIKNQANGLVAGVILVCILRFLCHVISGCTVWAGLSIPDNAALIYSLGYNATYMIPETIVTAVAAYYVGSILDLRGPAITNLKSKKEETKLPVLSWIAGLLIVGAVIFDVINVFMYIQNAETGEFDVTGLVNVNWQLVLIVSVTAFVVAGILFIISKKKKA